MAPAWQQVLKGNEFNLTCSVDTEDASTEVSWTGDGTLLTEGE